MIRRLVALSSLSLCIACAGHSEYLASDDASGGAGSLETGGSAPRPGGDRSGATAKAGDAGYVPRIESGTQNCENADFCFGLSCYAPPSFEPAVCVARCETDADCEPFEACVKSSRLEPTCYARCDSPSDCARHFDCLDFSGTGELVCFPTAWAARHSDLE